MQQEDFYAFLDNHGIHYRRFDHPPVYTCDQARELCPPDMDGLAIKNLFVCDDKGRQHFLVVTPADRQTDLKALAGELGVKKLRFGSEKRLLRHLGIAPGAVTLLAVVNDPDAAVSVVLDEPVAEADALLCHPLVNTSTLSIGQAHIRRFLTATGHAPLVIAVPARQQHG